MDKIICAVPDRHSMFSQIGERWVVSVGKFPDGSPVLCDLQGNYYYEHDIQGVRFAFLVRLSRLNTYWKKGVDVITFQLMLNEVIEYNQPGKVECDDFPVVPVDKVIDSNKTPLPTESLSHIKKFIYACLAGVGVVSAHTTSGGAPLAGAGEGPSVSLCKCKRKSNYRK